MLYRILSAGGQSGTKEREESKHGSRFQMSAISALWNVSFDQELWS